MSSWDSLPTVGGDKTIDSAPDKPDAAAPASPQMSALDRFGTGLMTPLVGAVQWAAHGAAGLRGKPEDEEEATRIDKLAKDRAETIKKESPPGFDAPQLAGEILSPINYAVPIPGGGALKAAAKLAAKATPQVLADAVKTAGRVTLASSATKGLIAGTLQPATGEDYLKEKTNQQIWGSVFGVAGGKTANVAGKFISPIISKAAQELASRGVQLTPGQLMQGFFKRAEEAAKSFPPLGHFIRGAEGRSIESWNKATLNEALGKINTKLPSSVDAGHEANSYAYHRFNDVYEDLLPKLKLRLSADFASDMMGIKSEANMLAPAQREHLSNILNETLGHTFKGKGEIRGDVFKEMVQRRLTEMSGTARSGTAAEQQMSRVIDKAQSVMRKHLALQNPEYAGQLEKIDLGYAMLSRVRDAATRTASKMGVFSPMDLSQAVKRGDNSASHTALFTGDALLQEYSDWGQTLLPNKMPDSGTWERAMWSMMGIGVLGGGAAAADRMTDSIAPAVGTVLGALPYTRPGAAVVRNWVAPMQAMKSPLGRLAKTAQQTVGGVAQSSSPVAAVGGADIANSVFGLGQ